MPSAVIVRAQLPPGLERLRRRCVDNAAAGVPAHMTLLHPFVEPDGLDGRIRLALAAVAARHRPFDYRQATMARWPDAVYVAVTPEAPFVRLHRDLQASFPTWPIYGEGPDFVFVPHITVADRRHVVAPEVAHDPGWRALPRLARAHAIEVIATGVDDRWRLVWRIPLGAVRAG
jgi:2'-5' RNA ligase